MINYKSLSALLMSGGLVLGFLVILLPCNMLRFGIGSLTLPIPVYQSISFTTISLGRFMLEAFVLLLLGMWLIIRLQIVLQLVLKSEFASLAMTSLLLVSETFILSRVWYPSITGLCTCYQVTSILGNWWLDSRILDMRRQR